MKGDKYSEYKNDGLCSMSQSCSGNATMAYSVPENDNDAKLGTHISTATHKLKRAFTPVLNNSSSKNSGNILPRLDEHTHFVKGLFVDIENKTNSMEEMMSRKLHKKILYQCLKVYSFFNLNITNLKNVGGDRSDNKEVWLFKCGKCHDVYKQNESIPQRMCFHFYSRRKEQGLFCL